jgi:hypothetical protein
MLYRVFRSLSSCLLAAALFGGLAIGRVSMFDLCKNRIDGIKNGTQTFRGITNETIGELLYNGPVGELSVELRNNFTTITTQGILLRP